MQVPRHNYVQYGEFQTCMTVVSYSTVQVMWLYKHDIVFYSYIISTNCSVSMPSTLNFASYQVKTLSTLTRVVNCHDDAFLTASRLLCFSLVSCTVHELCPPSTASSFHPDKPWQHRVQYHSDAGGSGLNRCRCSH